MEILNLIAFILGTITGFHIWLSKNISITTILSTSTLLFIILSQNYSNIQIWGIIDIVTWSIVTVIYILVLFDEETLYYDRNHTIHVLKVAIANNENYGWVLGQLNIRSQFWIYEAIERSNQKQ